MMIIYFWVNTCVTKVRPSWSLWGKIIDRYKYKITLYSSVLYKIMGGQQGQPQDSFGGPRASGKPEPCRWPAD